MNEQKNLPADATGGIGPVVGIVVIVALLLLGGFYFWKTNIKDDGLVGPSGKTAEEIAAETDPLLAEIAAQGASDELQDIENDLNANALNTLDTDMQDIGRELSAP